MKLSILARLTMVATWVISASSAFAQVDYPVKPVRVVVGLAAGGGTDLVARIVMPKVADALKQPFIIENRVGVSGMVASEYVSRSAPDGYTLLFSPQGVLIQNPVMYRKLPYATKDIVPISVVVTFPAILAVNPSLPAHNVKDLVAWLKENKAFAAFSGGAFNIGLNLFMLKTGVKVDTIQYKGANEVVQSVLSGTTQMTLVDVGPVLGALKGGRVRGLAVTTTERLAALPDIPTVGELGFPELELSFWMGLFAPAGVPAPVVKRLEGAIIQAVAHPEVKQQLSAKLTNPAGTTAEEAAKVVARGYAEADAIRKAANIPYLDQSN
jgi:tripartite-type tricarboxylate transporter receptor subunit TctC